MADAELERFVAQQQELGIWERTVMFVVSDHSMDTTLQKESLRVAFNAGGISDSDVLVVQNGSLDMVYLKDRDRPDRFEVLKQMREIAVGDDGRRRGALPRRQPADGGAAHTLERPPRLALAGDRTGDLFVTHVEGGACNEPNPLTGNHGGAADERQHVHRPSGGDRGRASRRSPARPGRASTTRCSTPARRRTSTSRPR